MGNFSSNPMAVVVPLFRQDLRSYSTLCWCATSGNGTLLIEALVA